jgi:hypothetical protein
LNYKAIEQIDEQLKQLECKSYTLTINFTDTDKFQISKEPDKNEKKIGY